MLSPVKGEGFNNPPQIMLNIVSGSQKVPGYITMLTNCEKRVKSVFAGD